MYCNEKSFGIEFCFGLLYSCLASTLIKKGVFIMEFCEKKSYLINQIMSLPKQQLLIVLENFPDIDIATLLIKEILDIDSDNQATLNRLVDVVHSVEESMDEYIDASYDIENSSDNKEADFPLIMEDDSSTFAIDDQSIVFINKRSAPRKSVCMDVNLVKNNQSLLEECVDISASGMFVKTEESFSTNEDITVSMMIAHNGNKEEVTFESKVVRTPGNGIGIQFNSMDCANRTRLEELLKNL